MSQRPTALVCHGVSAGYDGSMVLRGVDLVVEAGETVALLGPSGSGKTTLLYAIAGFLEPMGGEIRVADRRVAGNGRSLPPEQRDVAVVFQNYALWPHLTALQTVAYPLRRAKRLAPEAERRAVELLEMMGVAQLAQRRPAQLSGGEQQRVGVARALAREAGLVLLDEPTAHLDAPLRARLLAELTEQRRRAGTAALYATHDVGEALAVADRVALLRDGRMAQVGSPIEIYARPADAWVAGLSGPASMLVVSLVSIDRGAGDEPSAVLRLGASQVVVQLAGPPPPGVESVQLLVRPDWASLGGELDALVTGVLYRGPHTDYRLTTSAGELELREPGPPRLAQGEPTRWTLRRGWVMGPA